MLVKRTSTGDGDADFEVAGDDGLTHCEDADFKDAGEEDFTGEGDADFEVAGDDGLTRCGDPDFNNFGDEDFTTCSDGEAGLRDCEEVDLNL